MLWSMLCCVMCDVFYHSKETLIMQQMWYRCNSYKHHTTVAHIFLADPPDWTTMLTQSVYHLSFRLVIRWTIQSLSGPVMSWERFSCFPARLTALPAARDTPLYALGLLRVLHVSFVCVWAYCPWASWNTSKACFQTNQTAHSAERDTCFWFPLSDLECPSPEQIACVQRQRQHWDWLESIYVFAWRLPSYISHSAGHFNTQRLKTKTQLKKDHLKTWKNF